MNHLMICSKSNESLHLNESEKINSGRYILEGPVATLDKMNRNQRIYPKEEYLKHLQYLRDDLKHPEKGWILGEPGHPADRFETDIKEASHRILDLWYKPETNQVMGKIELLNTPNGQLLKGLVDEGMPLCISSRASGTVGSDSIVDIQQIFTYDVVIKPGFEDAVLHRVNESADTPKYSQNAQNFCNEELRKESKSIAAQLGLEESYSIMNMKSCPELREEAKNVKINKLSENNIKDMSKPVFEAADPDKTVGQPLEVKSSTTMFDPSKIVSSSTNEGTDDEKADDASLSTDGGEQKEESGDKKSDIEILDVTAEFDDDVVKDVEPVYGEDDDKKDDEKDDESESDDEDSTEVGEECKDGDCKKDECDGGDCKKDEKTVENDLNEVKEKKEDLEDHKKEFSDKLDKLLGELKNKKSVKESLVQKFPHAGLMNADEFKKFAALSEAQQIKVSNYLSENMIYSPDAVNKLWEGALVEVVNDQPIWLKNASDEYRNLYESATELQRKNLEICAKYCVFESQRDINNFWENSGLREAREQQLLNEAFINSMPKIKENVQVSDEMPYSAEFVNMITDAACEYDNRY